MNSNINEVIDKLCNKFNVSTAYLISEFTKLHIIQCVILIIISLIVFGFLFYITPKIWIYDEKEDTFFILIPICTGITFGTLFLVSLYVLISWFFSPTAMTVKTILEMMQK